jgi:tetratricopeptide (TPR) repeat protein
MAKKIPTSTIIDFAYGRLSPSESLEVLDSIERDPRASKELDLVVDLMNEAADPDSAVFALPVSVRRPFLTRWIRSFDEAIRNHPFLYPASAFGSLVVALSIVIGINLMSSSRLDELTGIDRTAFTWNARGTDNSDIAGAYVCFTNGEYEKSLSLLDRYLRLEPRGELAPYVHYTAGAVCLISSRRNYFSLFQTHDADRVSNALQHLSRAIDETSNRRLLEESRFLRAKGYLMLDRPARAIAELDTVRSLNGPRSEEAMQMIERIHALIP